MIQRKVGGVFARYMESLAWGQQMREVYVERDGYKVMH